MSAAGRQAPETVSVLASSTEVMEVIGLQSGTAMSIGAPQLGLGGTPSLVFQPAVDLATGRLLGFEALLRCHDAAGGNIPPDVLIPWAEAHGRMNELNEWVLGEACAQASRWPSDLQLAVNCSVFQLRRGTAAVAAAVALERSGLNPDRLTIEITEVSVSDQDAAKDLGVMARLGIQLTVDDVGSDYSVLENLRDGVINTVKIDAGLIAGICDPDGQSRAIVAAIVKLSRSLGICTVAEAVETGDQVAILRELGADTAQGYFFAVPVTAQEACDLANMDPHLCFALTLPSMPKMAGLGRS
jgi:EAL domain-containing protein (putative c-di-GMP-specific phosphodiesterase class I)